MQDISGKLKSKSRIWRRALRRHDFTLIFVISGLLIPGFIVYAIYDFLGTVKSKETQVQTAALTSELAQFALALRDDDGYSLIDNAEQLSRTSRQLKAIPLEKSFFGYFLNRGNAKAFETRNLSWEAPKACSVNFSPLPVAGKDQTAADVRACLAYIPNDIAGRFIYFSLRFPSRGITRHEQGDNFTKADHVSLTLKGARRSTHVQLVFEAPTLARDRYPSQPRRFLGLHEVTAYSNDNPRHLVREISGQAYEQQIENNTGWTDRYVTLLVRIDGSILLEQAAPVAPVQDRQFGDVTAAIGVYIRQPEEKKSALFFDIPFGTTGHGQISLENLYTQHITSKAPLDIRLDSISGRSIWSSESLLVDTKKSTGSFQAVSDGWAKFMVNLFGYKSTPVTITQNVRASKPLVAILKQDEILVPDVAARSLLYLTLALALITAVSAFWWRAISHLHRIARKAYLLTSVPTMAENLGEYSKRRDEIGRLGRAFNLLISRSRSRNTRLTHRMHREEMERVERNRIENEQVRARQAILDAIGHEIKSPLQALSTKILDDSPGSVDVKRMLRAVEMLDLAASVEAGLRNSVVVTSKQDIAKYVSTYVRNTTRIESPVIYEGEESGIVALYDPLALETVFDHLMDNANRHKVLNSTIKISLRIAISTVQIEIYNEGENIPETQIERIFDLGATLRHSTENLGQGLFVARANMVAMNGSIVAANKDAGVLFLLELPKE